MKAIVEKQKQSIKVLDYDQAILHISEIFPSASFMLDDKCIESFGHVVADGKIAQTYVWYNKIAVEFDGKKLYWPIQPYKLIDPCGREFSHFDTFKSY